MIRFINRVSGGIMYVHESRVEEYLKLGHRLAPLPSPAHPLQDADGKNVSDSDTIARRRR